MWEKTERVRDLHTTAQTKEHQTARKMLGKMSEEFLRLIRTLVDLSRPEGGGGDYLPPSSTNEPSRFFSMNLMKKKICCRIFLIIV